MGKVLPSSLLKLVGIFAIAAIEGRFLMRGLQLRYGESYRHAVSANRMSTIYVIPLVWLIWMAGLVPMTKGLTAIGIDVPTHRK